LRFHTVGSVNDHERGVHGGEHAVGVLAEVFVAGGVQQVDHVVAVQHLHDRAGHRDATLLFDFHPVRSGMARSLAGFDRPGDLDCAREQQELFRERGFTRVRVRDDGKRPAAPGFEGVGQWNSEGVSKANVKAL
jgi:hypothetical protein